MYVTCILLTGFLSRLSSLSHHRRGPSKPSVTSINPFLYGFLHIRWFRGRVVCAFDYETGDPGSGGITDWLFSAGWKPNQVMLPAVPALETMLLPNRVPNYIHVISPYFGGSSLFFAIILENLPI